MSLLVASAFGSPDLEGIFLFTEVLGATAVSVAMFGLTAVCYVLRSLRGQFRLHSAVALMAAVLPAFPIFQVWRGGGRADPFSPDFAVWPWVMVLVVFAMVGGIAGLRHRYDPTQPLVPQSRVAAGILWSLTVVVLVAGFRWVWLR